MNSITKATHVRHVPVSVLVLTKNEERDLPACLSSVLWSDDIHVFDSFSSDDTVAVARGFGAHVTQRPFDNWASHQNWGLTNITFRNPWVLYIDADERVTESLRDAIFDAVGNSGSSVAFEIRRRDFMGKVWLKRTQATPRYIRLFRPACVRYERLVNPITIVEGKIGRLAGYLDHHPFSKGIAHWVSRHNAYSDLEAKEISCRREQLPFLTEALFGKDLSRRRASQKTLYYRMPLRPLVKFAYMYFIKAGFLDGRAGFRYAILIAFYEYLIVLKTEENDPRNAR